MAVITAYLDDSGTSPANPVACTAGFISPLYQWREFEHEWRAAMRVKGDKFEGMHIAECAASHPKSEYCNWDLEKKRRVLKRLRRIIKQRTLVGVGMAVSKYNYENLVPADVKKKTGNNFTYTVLLTMALAGGWRRRNNIVEPIEYVFDWMEPKDEKRRQLEELFENECSRGQALNDYGMVSGGYSFRHKEDVLPLQAADMAAWTLYNVIQHALKIKPVNLLAGEGYKDFQSYKKPHQKWWNAGFLTEAQMQEFAHVVPASPDFAAAKELRPPKKKKK